MDASKATDRILRGGVGPELVSAFRCIAEATTPAGHAKYSRKVNHALVRTVACRAYARPIYQLCHLINAADACGQRSERFERFFFGIDRALARNFKAHIQTVLASRSWRRPGFETSEIGIVIHYEDGVFNIPYGRMPLLCALLEFLIATGSYTAVDAIFADMLRDASRMTAVKTAANALERHLYRYLNANLTGVQQQNKFTRILEFLKERAGPDDGFEIDDDTVLAFWRDHCAGAGEETGDFRTYRAVFDAFLAFFRAIERADSYFAADGAAPIGSDREAGEIDPDSLSSMLDEPGEWQSPLEVLEAAPTDRIKLLNKKEAAYLALLCECGPLAQKLPMSLMRTECFGKAQARITQGLRRRLPQSNVLALASCHEVESYQDRRSGYADARVQIERALRAAAFALLRDRSNIEDNIIAFPGTDGAIPADALDDIDASDLDQAFAAARGAFREISRKGFDEEGLDDSETVEGFRAGAGALMRLNEQIDAYLEVLEVLDQRDPDLDRRFAADRDVFRTQFSRLYGERA